MHLAESQSSEERERVVECVPGDEKWLVQAVEDIDDEIVISNRVNIWAWELTIDEYPLKKNKNKEQQIGSISIRSDSEIK